MTERLRRILTDPERLAGSIRRKQAELELVESVLYPAGIRYDRDKVQTSPRSDQIPEAIAKAEPIQKDIDQLQEKFAVAVAVRSKTMDCLTDTEAGIVLARLVSDKSWADLEDVMCYSRSQMNRLYRGAIDKMEACLEKDGTK